MRDRTRPGHAQHQSPPGFGICNFISCPTAPVHDKFCYHGTSIVNLRSATFSKGVFLSLHKKKSIISLSLKRNLSTGPQNDNRPFPFSNCIVFGVHAQPLGNFCQLLLSIYHLSLFKLRTLLKHVTTHVHNFLSSFEIGTTALYSQKGNKKHDSLLHLKRQCK